MRAVRVEGGKHGRKTEEKIRGTNMRGDTQENRRMELRRDNER